MKAELKRLHSPDADLTSGNLPEDALFVQLMIGPEGSPGEESFDVVVCTPRSHDRVIDPEDPDSGKYLLILDRIDAGLIEQYVREYLRDLDRPTWQELAQEIGKLGKWEFQDYQP
ncbi:Imm8 family immunity protein [Nocardia sp. NPDC051570]|uniref:Imm8 family immunity protein n=1 Tax=Nocardia sp. NPDC051570 TaxID=3364324 RepID=UPI0037A765D9